MSSVIASLSAVSSSAANSAVSDSAAVSASSSVSSSDAAIDSSPASASDAAIDSSSASASDAATDSSSVSTSVTESVSSTVSSAVSESASSVTVSVVSSTLSSIEIVSAATAVITFAGQHPDTARTIVNRIAYHLKLLIALFTCLFHVSLSRKITNYYIIFKHILTMQREAPPERPISEVFRICVACGTDPANLPAVRLPQRPHCRGACLSLHSSSPPQTTDVFHH